MNPKLSIYLNTHYTLKDGTHPVKLQVFISKPKRVQKWLPTIYSYTPHEFDRIWNGDSPSKSERLIRKQLKDMVEKATDIAHSMDSFDIDLLRELLKVEADGGVNLVQAYEKAILRLVKQDRLGSAETYSSSLKSLRVFRPNNFDNLTLTDITATWLEDYELFMKRNGKSITTTGFYLRPLQTTFNEAIHDKLVSREHYPFGKKKYQIPSSKKVNKALSADGLRKLFHTEAATPEQEKAKDYWFLSFLMNGINLKDLSLMTEKDLHIENGVAEKIVFYRAKTQTTSKTNLTPITIYLNDYIRMLMNKYKGRPPYLLDILKPNMTSEKQRRTVSNLNRAINQNLQLFTKNNGLPADISYQWARHSFATAGIRNGKPIEFMRDALGHSDSKTTLNYIATFDDASKKEFSDELLSVLEL